MQINWIINEKEAAQIIQALADRPYRETNQLIGKLHSETTKQIAEYEAGTNGDGIKHK